MIILDPIADLLTRIRNAIARKKSDVFLPFSEIKFYIAKVMLKANFIASVEKINEKDKDKDKEIRIVLKYDEEGNSAIQSLQRISKPGKRVYAGSKEIPNVLGGLGIVIISTSQGIMTGRDARNRKLGGELVCEIY